MKIIFVLGVVYFAGVFGSVDVLKNLKNRFLEKADAEPSTPSSPAKPSALSNFLSKLNGAPKQTDTASEVTETAKNQAKHYNGYPFIPPPSPYYQPPSPFSNPFNTNPYSGSSTPFINPSSPPQYYRDPTGKVYTVLYNGNLRDQTTGQEYPIDSFGNRVIGQYVVNPYGETFINKNGQVYKIQRDATNNVPYYVDTNGIKKYIRSDGTEYYYDPTNNVTFYKSPDGTDYYIGANGIPVYRDPTNGDVYTRDSAGNTYRTRTDNTRYIRAANGCTYNVDANNGTTLTSTTNTACPATFTGTAPDGTTFSG